MYQSKKPLSAKDEDSLKAEAAKMAKSPDVTNASYIGDGRFNIAMDNSRKPGAAMNMMDMIKVSFDKDGVMTITPTAISDQARSQINALGLNISGTLEVDLPKNAVILYSNTNSSPSFFGMLGTYGWKIGSVEQTPMMRIRFDK